MVQDKFSTWVMHLFYSDFSESHQLKYEVSNNVG